MVGPLLQTALYKYFTIPTSVQSTMMQRPANVLPSLDGRRRPIDVQSAVQLTSFTDISVLNAKGNVHSRSNYNEYVFAQIVLTFFTFHYDPICNAADCASSAEDDGDSENLLQ